MLAIFTVTNVDDAVANTPEAIGTLRQAIFDANADDDHDTIEFASSLNNATITLTQGRLTITESVTIDGTIDGAGPSEVSLDITIDAQQNSRIFHVANSSLTGTITLAGMTLTGGATKRHEKALRRAQRGGAHRLNLFVPLGDFSWPFLSLAA
jgi:hypothetical protein